MNWDEINVAIFVVIYLIFADDDEKPDVTPSDSFVRAYRVKLRKLELILNDVYPPAKSYKSMRNSLRWAECLYLWVIYWNTSKFNHIISNLNLNELKSTLINFNQVHV